MVAMNIFGMALDETSQAPILILKNENESMALPIWIGAVEAMSISMALNNVPFPRPMTHDLLLASVRALGGKVSHVDILEIREGTFFAELVLEQNEKEVRIDCRPSDAIAVAVRSKSSIFVAQGVLDSAGVSGEALDKKIVRSDESDKWKDLLDSLDDAETKYKM